MTIKEVENKRRKGYLNFNEFYHYFKNCDYSLSLKTIINMYKIYVR